MVTLPDTKTNQSRFLTIGPEFNEIVKKYQALRPEKVTSDKFSMNYQRGNCINQVIGKNKIAGHTIPLVEKV